MCGSCGRGTVLAALLFAGGCGSVPDIVGSGAPLSETRELAPFTSVAFDGFGRLEITIGERSPLRITGDDNVVPLVRTQVAEGTLQIWPSRPIRPRQSLVIQVSTPELTEVTCRGATELLVSGLREGSLDVQLAGAARFSGSGELDELKVMATGAAELLGEELKARQAEISILGTARVRVHATDKLKISIRGSGSVVYSGDPQLEQSIYGAGTVSRRK